MSTPVEPPQYWHSNEFNALYFSKPERVGDSIVITVSTSELHEFQSALFTIDQDSSAPLRTFKILPYGQNYDPDGLNEFYYSFTFCQDPPDLSNIGRTGYFRISGGRGFGTTPVQVPPYPAFLDLGEREGNRMYAHFLNPFKRQLPKKGLVQMFIPNETSTRFEWISDSAELGEEQLFRLEQWQQDKFNKPATVRHTIAEYCVSQSGAKLFSTAEKQLWDSMEECAYIVGTAYGAYMARDVRHPKGSIGRVMFEQSRKIFTGSAMGGFGDYAGEYRGANVRRLV
ncbi:hypothetical protein HDU83_006973 [Entophlyctis luteolus]|nr:hypothetical protein HDU83_006973 [Entophlyctis luteolus]KAJ3388249.1 hypothetical protein HDU84_000170 [Entophlyctis sp. JEL0112]